MACYQVRNSHDTSLELKKVVYDSKATHARAGDHTALPRNNGIRSANLVYNVPGFHLGGATTDHFAAGTKLRRVSVPTEPGKPSIPIPLSVTATATTSARVAHSASSTATSAPPTVPNASAGCPKPPSPPPPAAHSSFTAPRAAPGDRHVEQVTVIHGATSGLVLRPDIESHRRRMTSTTSPEGIEAAMTSASRNSSSSSPRAQRPKASKRQ